MNPFTPELGKAPVALPVARTGILTTDITHNTRDDDRELESKKKWGYYKLTGEVSQKMNPDSAPCKPYFVRFYPFACARTLDRGNGYFDFYYRAIAVLAYVDPYDCEVGDFYKRFEIVREYTLYVPNSGDKIMRFEKKVYRIPAHIDSKYGSLCNYEEIELWERVS